MKRLMMLVGALVIAAPAWAQGGAPPPAGAPAGAPAAGRQGGGPPPIDVPYNDAIPAGTADHATRALKESPRHGEWVDIKLADGTNLNSWVVYPQSATKTAVVLVIHDINGMRDLPRAVGDQLAQDGFIAIVPDFLSGKGPNGGGSDSLGSGVGQAIRTLTPEDVNARLNAAMEYGRKLPSSNGKTGVVGFCWGGARSFGFAAAQPALNASVVYYGEAPGSGDNTLEAALANLKAPVLGLYGGTDMRIGATVPGTVEAMKKLGKTYEPHTFEGAGHGFMGGQAGMGGANLKASLEAWPLTIAWFKKYLQ